MVDLNTSPHSEHELKSADGGLAFPGWIGGGMSLRDYFAAHAMAGTVNHPEGPDFKTAAKQAYKMADEMLKAREVKP